MNPYTKIVEANVNAGEATLIELGVPSKGTINKLIMNQVVGVPEGYTYNIFDMRDAAEGATSPGFGSSSASDADAIEPSQCKVIPTMTVAAGTRADEHFEKVWTYANQDGGPTNRVRKLYLVVEPAGSGVKNFEIALSIVEGGAH